MGARGLVFLLLTRTPLSTEGSVARRRALSNVNPPRGPLQGARTPPGLERAPLYRYLDDLTPRVCPPCPLCPHRLRVPPVAQTRRPRCALPLRPHRRTHTHTHPLCRHALHGALACRRAIQLLLRASSSLQTGNASVREMYLNIDAVVMHEPGTVNGASCSGRPGRLPALAEACLLPCSGWSWQASAGERRKRRRPPRKESAACRANCRRYAFI